MYQQLSYIFFLSSVILHAISTCTDCQKEKCPPCWTAYKDHCYRYFDQALTWVEAGKECGRFGSPNGLGEAYLLTLHSAQEEEFVFDFAKSSSKNLKVLWLGFHDAEKEGRFKWVDGKTGDYTNWREKEPNDFAPSEDCATLVMKGKKWNDLACNKPKVKVPFICKMRRV